MAEITVGVVADTHIPDRARALHPGLLPALAKAGVARILHAGDICVPAVLEQLGQVAAVTAVRGNRDWLFGSKLPWLRRLDFCGVPVLLIHGQGNLAQYVLDKAWVLLQGYRFSRYQAFIAAQAQSARVIVFGHTHQAENRWEDGRLWFNPGSASGAMLSGDAPSFGLLHFGYGGEVRGEIVALPRAAGEA